MKSAITAKNVFDFRSWSFFTPYQKLCDRFGYDVMSYSTLCLNLIFLYSIYAVGSAGLFVSYYLNDKKPQVAFLNNLNSFFSLIPQTFIQLWEVELLFLVYYVSNYILKYFATSNADDKFQYIISSWRLFMNYSLTQEGQKYDFDRIRPQSTIQSRYLIFQKGKIEITTCIKRTAMTKINAVEDVQGRSTNSLNKLRQF
ncbi:Transmembrane_domain-containing protein [Hexamita inflata]|uniref:Transmembrane domain-containing protein n=1 Tax=Hexamita inflata TaxID=28002 RepID=A0AA86UMR9_9EUKA|nr:Transmembrane domain-containing protein [Hexamita inflata]